MSILSQRQTVFIPAALLHDVLDKKYVTKQEVADPYAFVLPFFQDVGSTEGVAPHQI
jgi:hypothetical protein